MFHGTRLAKLVRLDFLCFTFAFCDLRMFTGPFCTSPQTFSYISLALEESLRSEDGGALGGLGRTLEGAAWERAFEVWFDVRLKCV